MHVLCTAIFQKSIDIIGHACVFFPPKRNDNISFERWLGNYFNIVRRGSGISIWRVRSGLGIFIYILNTRYILIYPQNEFTDPVMTKYYNNFSSSVNNILYISICIVFQYLLNWMSENIRKKKKLNTVLNVLMILL